VVADACAELALLAVAVAVFGYTPQLEAVVALAICTEAVPPDDRLPKLQLKLPLAIAQLPGPVYAGLMLQLSPGPAGSTSLTATKDAGPVPLSVTDSVKPIELPAATKAASAVLLKLRFVVWLKRLDTSEAVNARL